MKFLFPGFILLLISFNSFAMDGAFYCDGSSLKHSTVEEVVSPYVSGSSQQCGFLANDLNTILVGNTDTHQGFFYCHSRSVMHSKIGRIDHSGRFAEHCIEIVENLNRNFLNNIHHK